MCDLGTFCYRFVTFRLSIVHDHEFLVGTLFSYTDRHAYDIPRHGCNTNGGLTTGNCRLGFEWLAPNNRRNSFQLEVPTRCIGRNLLFHFGVERFRRFW